VTETPIDPNGPEIVTEGTGWFEQLGDQAELTATFTGFAENRNDAVRELGRRLAAAGPALELPGLLVRDRRFWVHDEWQTDRVIGCRAGEDLALTLTDPAMLERVLSAIVGAEPTGLHGPRWVLANPAVAQREAQHRAVEDARQRAEGYAEALGGRLGALRRLSDAPTHGGAVALSARDSMGGPDVQELKLEPEPVRVTAHCTISWTLIT
jgi:uncharacterized protein YggE